MTQSSKQDLRRFLRKKGFRLRAPQSGAEATYEGPLPFRGTAVPIRLSILDWDFKARPEIRLLNRPDALRGFRPHLGLGSVLCYLDRESVYMDPYDPRGVIGRCLEEATGTLEEIAGHRSRLDLQGEFLVNWSASVLVPLMLWTEADAAKRMLATIDVDFPHLSRRFVVTDSIKRTSECLTAIGAKVGAASEEVAVEFITDKTPEIDPDNWPPRKLRDVFDWVEGWDPELRRSMFGRLESQWTKGKTNLTAVLSTPAGRFGYWFPVDLQEAERNRLAKRPTDRRQRIWTQNPAIKRFVVSELSPRYLHGRNLSERETLAGKKLALVGGGTVGGYVATFLAKLGAGFDGGSLKIYETQSLMPENLGRHVLSFADLFRNKAEGIVDLLAKEVPYADIQAIEKDATEASDLFNSDLIIDASGSSAVAGALNREHVRRLKSGDTSSAVLYVWVEGPGDAARCLLVDSLRFMCHECLRRRQADQPPELRFPVSTREAADGREHPGGCGSYMPFAVSASATAASLALDTARDWARGDPHPRLRSRRLDLKNTMARDDSSPKPLDSCPACRPK